MTTEFVLFEVNYGGRFQRMPRTEYLRGKKALHHESWDTDLLAFFELDTLCIEYGYTQGDLMYYAHLAKSLDEELALISSDVDVLEMVSCHKGHNTIILYMVGFGEEAAQQQQQRKRFKLPMVKKGATDKGDKGKGKKLLKIMKNLLKDHCQIHFGIK
ncbi:hypothetical protein CJ030_MR4G018358 [Morella rubra]|uniref:PB1-like domain-containing protein n=1 Tax=Morella rubra TaxID=262757 RepID=A0A6A1VXE5_9ROSI|nr:hypothetical protein CJ030_MR4G018358 [Morella rubra]